MTACGADVTQHGPSLQQFFTYVLSNFVGRHSKNLILRRLEMVAPRFILTHKPLIPKSCFIHPSAVVAGYVKLGEDVSIWPNAVLRGDSELIQLYVHLRCLD
jgi:UDP-3-O-[3-hydroxymyristoyl] glucosamine N-acyltransferase